MTDERDDDVRTARLRLGLLTALTQAALWLERLIVLLAPAGALVFAFVALSWTGFWLEAPPAGRLAGALLFAALLAAALSRLRHLRWVGEGAARAALDAGREDAPAAALADALANAGAAPTELLWAAHLRRVRKNLGKLRLRVPAPRLAAQDRHGLGALAVLAFCATAFVAGPEKDIRLAAAFDWRLTAPENATRVDVWIDPPRYTGKPPVVLTLNRSGAQEVAAPVGSIVVARASRPGALDIVATGGLSPAPAKDPAEGDAKGGAKSDPKSDAKSDPKSDPKSDAKAPANGAEKRFLLRGDGRLTLSGAAAGLFDLRAEPDLPPKIAVIGKIRVNARGTFSLDYRIDDDYGARDAKITAVPAQTPGRPLFAPPEAALDLPAAPGGLGEARAVIDWSDSPYAGGKVTLRLSVHDEAGQEGVALVKDFVLPQKPLRDPLARALAEQRDMLARDADSRSRAQSALEALDLAPELFTPKLAVHLGLRYGAIALRHARSDDDLREVADFLWAMALQIDEGDMSQAERDLRAAEKALRDAMKAGASQEEIDRLARDMQKAMETYLSEMAKKAQHRNAESQTGQGHSLSPEDFRKMLEQMKKAMQDGDMETAQALLDQMQSMLDNLRAAEGGPSQKARDRRTRRDLDGMMREQQQLRDETAEQERGKGAQAPGSPEPEGRRQDGSREGARPGGGPQQQGQNAGKGQNGDKPGGDEALRRRQGQLREKLDALRRGAPGMDEQAAEGLKQAEEAMKSAEEALKQGDEGQAMDAQQRALDRMGKSAGQMAKGEKDGEDAQDAGGERRGGRSRNGEGPFDNAQRSDGIKATAAQRARKILDELRRRLSDPSRAQEELEYLERLIRPN
jgi:uncharacterized protein (TIGR02302 family)